MQQPPSATPRRRVPGAAPRNRRAGAGRRSAGRLQPESAAPPMPPAAFFSLPGNGQAAVVWAAPAQRADVTSYVATARPGGRTCTSTTVLRCTITGLTNGRTYAG